jgi:hypothetical protein
MAEAKSTTVEKVVETVEKLPAYQLTLSEEEAQALMVLTGSVHGDRRNSPRKHTDAIYYALSRAGARLWDTKVSKQLTGSPRWLNEPRKVCDY